MKSGSGAGRRGTGEAMKPKVLVVDDSADNRLIYRALLAELADVQVLEAGDGAHALDLAASTRLACCLVGVNRPDMDGFVLTERLHALDGHAATPVILVSSETPANSALTRGYRSGAVDFVSAATARGPALVRKVRVFIDLYREQQELLARIGELERALDETLQQQDELRAKAMLDPLTGLPNRALFRDRLHAACARAGRHRQRFAVAYLDLDGFKRVNDEHGHPVGDRLLVAIAQQLSQAVRATDTVARLGGDEFGIVLESIDGPDAAARVARKIHALVSRRYALEATGQPTVYLDSRCSIGLAVYPEHGREIDRLIFRADIAMYAAKHAGEDVRVYDEAETAPATPAAPRQFAPLSAERH